MNDAVKNFRVTLRMYLAEVVEMVTQLRVRSQVDQDGKVHIQMPPELMGKEIELFITVDTEPQVKTVEELGYPADFFETVAWVGELERADQGEVTPRDWGYVTEG